MSQELRVPLICTQHHQSGVMMQTINVREAREKLSSVLDAVAAGEEVVILRRGKPVARLSPPRPEAIRFIDRSELRASLPKSKETAAAVVRSLRDEERC